MCLSFNPCLDAYLFLENINRYLQYYDFSNIDVAQVV